jgi:uncharacterized protein (DUF1330 family)
MKHVNPSTEEILAMTKTAPEGPVVMVNLFKFETLEAQQRFFPELTAITAPMIERAGAERVYAGAVAGELIKQDDWDLVVIVRYPNFQAVADLVADPVWLDKAAALRDECLADSRLILTTEL